MVGYQPEEMVIVGNKLYVANSGGYRVPNYDHIADKSEIEKYSEADIEKLDKRLNAQFKKGMTLEKLA